MHERDNPFDLFGVAIKKITEETVRHLPMENSRVTKCLMDRRARFTVILTFSQYCVSPLVHCGLEVPSEVRIYLPLTPKNNEPVEIYNNLIQLQIYPRPESFMIGSFLLTSTEVYTPLTANKSKKKEAGEKKLGKNRIDNQKNRHFFSAKSEPDLHLRETTAIEISSEQSHNT